MTSARQTLGVGVIGLGWMGEAHARAYLRAPRHFPADNLEVRLVACADNVARRAEATARRYGFAEHSTDWRAVVAHREVDLVSITAPNHLHLEIVEAAAAAGKHIFCEKPVGRFLAETAAAAAAARAAGVVTGVGYNYRWAPLVQHCGRLIRAGALGGIRHFHGRFFTMYGSHPLSRLTWRFDREVSGHGAAGDILAHVIDTALFLAGPIKRVVGRQQTDIAQRPLPAPGRGTHFSLGGAGDRKGAVTNEDYVGALLEFAGGGGGTVEASRTVPGPKCEFAFEIYGEKGALRWDFERMNEAEVFLVGGGGDGGGRGGGDGGGRGNGGGGGDGDGRGGGDGGDGGGDGVGVAGGDGGGDDSGRGGGDGVGDGGGDGVGVGVGGNIGAGFTRIVAGEQHPAHAAFNPGEAVGLGYEDLKVIELRDFLRRAAQGKHGDGDGDADADGFPRALAAAQVIDAILRSCDSGRWEEV